MPLFHDYNVEIVRGSHGGGLGVPSLPADNLLQRDQQGDRALITTKFSWSRVSAALGVLALILIAGWYTAHDPEMKDWSKALLTAFTGLLGGLAGIIVGEKTAGPDIQKLLSPATKPQGWLGSSSQPRS
jgi:hypothetical protein